MALALGRRRGQKGQGLGINRVYYRSIAIAAFIFWLLGVAFWQGLIFAPNAVSPSLSQDAGGLRVTNEEKTNPIRKWDSSKSVVMGLASGYPMDVFELFVGSLRATGFSGAIILGIASDAPQDVRDYLAETNVTVKEVTLGPCTYHDKPSKCLVGFPDYKLSWVRFPLSKQWLLECKECTDGIMMTDVRDAYFQADPFTHSSIKYPPPGLMTFEEMYPDQTTEHWITEAPIKKCKGYDIGNHPMLCSGSTMGTREGILNYIDVMIKEFDAWNKDKKCFSNMAGDDQSIHNHLYYSGMFGNDTAAIPHRTGPIHVVGVQANTIFRAAIKEAEKVGKDEGWVNAHRLYGTEENWQEWLDPKHGLIDPDTGFITNMDGSPSPQVHQFDRFGLSINRFFLARKSEEWKLK
jgi:hypothetical protein